MTGRPAEAISGYVSVAAAARELGVTAKTIYKHLRAYGDLSRLQRRMAALRDPRGLALPDGSFVPTVAEAARRLGMSEDGINHHLREYGHLRGAGTVQRDRPAGSEGARRVKLAPVPGVEIAGPDPRPETAPRGSRMVSGRAVDVEAVIATIRQCRDDYLAERERAA
ncbi:hypothetical protein LO749_09360 [Paracoccus denitrificans]|uniref:NUMOD1 domain-containing DNA-binding protein n=1 Tax=Paracoccus denitrificans TaxID=266 RepID=UPI001E46ADE6|nr:NUMOD1 domain-containing DNA-binding protein [Paracoccus denitrificans]UFS64375.1 hypothetical protein LO749_09360 [Paracoccus denitrificans]